MKIRNDLRTCLLLAVIVACPTLSHADSATNRSFGSREIRPATHSQRHSGDIQQVMYQADGESRTSTVDAELRQIYYQNDQSRQGNQVQVRRRRSAKAMRQQQQAQGAQANGANAEPKKPGLLKRWFGKLGKSSTDDKDSPYVDQGGPSPKIPKPPAIVYGNEQPARKPNSVPAHVTGYQKKQPPSVPAVDTPSSYSQHGKRSQPAYGKPTLHRPGTGGYVPAMPNQRTASSDGFVDPFDEQSGNSSDAAILDLDSLIERQERSDSQSGLQKQSSEAEQIVPELAEQVAELAESKSADNPFTGYQLEEDDGFSDEVTIKASPSSEDFEEFVPEFTPGNSESSSAITLPIVNEEQPPTDEPILQLPAATEETQEAFIETQTEPVPLLDNSNDNAGRVDLPNMVEEAETWEESLPAVEQVETPDAPKEPIVEQQQQLPTTESQRLHALDSRARQEQQRYRIMARAGQTAFKGFCPVALRDDRELLDSRKQYRAKFGLRTYYFHTPEAKSAFEANPSRYAPAAGGSDVVLLVNTGEDVVGSLDFSLWYRDRIYMFRSRETQAIFSKNPKQYANQY